MSGRLISIIYFYLISTIALVLLIIGIYHAVTFVVNLTQYDAYPLRYARIEDCDLYPGSPMRVLPPDGTTEVSLSAEEKNRQKQVCLKNLEAERTQHKIDDMKNAFYFILVGSLLFALHFPIALRRSRESK